MMIIVLQIVCMLEAFGLVLAIRALRRVQAEAERQQARNAELQASNAQLFMEIDDTKDSADVVRRWYQQLFENTNDMVLVHRVDENGEPGTFAEVNRVACEMLGYTRDELLQKTPRDIEQAVAPEASWRGTGQAADLTDDYIGKWLDKATTDSSKSSTSEVLAKGELVYDRIFKTRLGDKIPVEVLARRVPFNDNPFILLTVKDSTKREDNEAARRESETRLSAFFEKSPFGIAMYDKDRNLVKANKACLDMFGFPEGGELDRFNLFENPYVPSDVKARVIRGETVQYEAQVDFEDAVRRSLCVTTRKGTGWFVVVMSGMGFGLSSTAGYFAEVKDLTSQRKLEADIRRLNDTASSKEGITGSLSDIMLTDLMQIVCAAGRSMKVTITREKNSGLVMIESGNIVHCKANKTTGEDAFYELMRWQEGEFTGKACSKFPERTITASLMSLLMEGARRADEASETA